MPSPKSWRGSGNPVNLPSHVGLVGKAGFYCDSAQTLGPFRNPKPRDLASVLAAFVPLAPLRV